MATRPDRRRNARAAMSLRIASAASLLLAGCMATSGSDALVESKPYIEMSSDPARLSCNGRKEGDAFGSRMARTAVLTAPNGSRSAYAEVVATATEWKDGARDCRSVSRLFLSDGGDYRVAFEQNPGAEGQTGNSLELIGWSPDGSRLLMELTLWTYPTDVINPMIVIYDTTNDTTRQLPIEARLKERYPGKCFIGVRAAGFTAGGEVIVESGPHGRGNVGSPAPDCTQERRSWAFNEAEQSIRQVP